MRGLLFGRLDRLRLHSPGRNALGIGIYQDSDAGKNERYREELPHIEGHTLFEANLRLLDEFDEETHAEAADQERAEEKSPRKTVEFLPIEADKDQSENKVGSCLVQLRGMLGLGLTVAVEDESPGQRSDVAVDFGIEEVAETDETPCKSDGYA